MHALILTAVLAQTPTPTPDGDIVVRDVRRVFHNGEHNAFTDLIRYKDRYYLAFRSCPDGHMVHPTSSIIVLASDNLRDWSPVHRFSAPLRDVRDPHFVVFRSRLFVYTGTWYCGKSSPKSYELNEQLGYACFTDDGRSWSKPIVVEGTFGHYIWRAAVHDGKVWLCGRRKRGFVRTRTRAERDAVIQSALLVSDDGLAFRTAGFFQEEFGDETAFVFESDGAIRAICRSGGGRNAQYCQSRPPYRDWDRKDLGQYLGGPMLARWGNEWIVGGREQTSSGPRTAFYWLTDGGLRRAAYVPSGGDTSYPGFLAISADRAAVSWYSSHERGSQGEPETAIYMAELRRTQSEEEPRQR